MSTTLFTRRPSWVGVLVLLAIVAALLPPRHASAVPFAILNFTKVEFNQKVYDTWLMGEKVRSNSKALHVESLIRINLVADHLLSEAAIYDASEILQSVDALNERYYKRLGERGADAAYRDSLPNNVVAEAMFAAALETPPFRDNVKDMYLRMKVLGKQVLADNTSAANDLALARTFVEGNTLEDATEKVLREQTSEMAARGKTDPLFAKAWDAFVIAEGIDDTISLEDIRNFDAKKYLAEHPELGVPQQIQDAIKPDGSMEISLADLEMLAKNEFGKINASIDDMQKTLVTISKQQGELVDFMKDQQKRQEAQAIAEAKAKEHQLKLAAANSTVSIISTLVGLKYPERGKQIAVVGQSAIKIGESLSGWMQAVSGLNGLSKIGSLSTVVMTGNILGAVMNVVNLFGPQQPTPEQIILEEIGKLRQEVNELRTEMHTRFDQVDKELTKIYSTMNDRFNQIDIQLGKINGSLEEIQQSLFALGLQLDRMERNNFEFLDALGRRPLREAMNGALNYKDRTGLDMGYQPEFVNYENIFHTWGTVNAFDALSAGPTERNYSDGQVLAELSAAPLDANVNYLNGWLIAHGMQPFATKRLPSPRDWAFASRAYADMGLDWPEHLKRIGVQRQASLDAVGADLQQAMQNISTIQTPNGPQGNAPLWNGLADYYNAKLTGLDNALVASEATYVGDIQATLKRPAPFELYGDLDQSLPYPYLPAEFSTFTCGGTSSVQLSTPHNLKNALSGYNRFALADYFGLKPIKVCFGAEWVEVSDVCYPTPATCEPYGKLKVRLGVVSDQVSLTRSEVVGNRQKVGNTLEVLTRDWLTYKQRFEAQFGGMTEPIPLTPEGTKQLETVSSAVLSKLAEYQRAHAGRVLNELNTGSLRARAVELAGAKKLVESFVTLGFPRAIDSDDLLRSLLLSKESLLDDQQIALAYVPPPVPTLSATQAISEGQLLANPRVKLLETGQKRHDALRGLLTDYLSNISTDNYREDNALISGTRFDMLLARAFADPNAPLPGQNRVVFLPLVRR